MSKIEFLILFILKKYSKYFKRIYSIRLNVSLFLGRFQKKYPTTIKTRKKYSTDIQIIFKIIVSISIYSKCNLIYPCF